MIMNLNEVLTKQNLITKLVLKEGDKELPKELKVKLMRIRMAYNKIKQSFDEEVKEFSKELISEEYETLANKTDRTTEEEAKYKELTDKINLEYQEFLIQKGDEEVTCIEDTLTMEEYSDILDVNSGNDVEINGNKVSAADLLEVIYSLFVKE